jgi:hypothetical protein
MVLSTDDDPLSVFIFMAPAVADLGTHNIHKTRHNPESLISDLQDIICLLKCVSDRNGTDFSHN